MQIVAGWLVNTRCDGGDIIEHLRLLLLAIVISLIS